MCVDPTKSHRQVPHVRAQVRWGGGGVRSSEGGGEEGEDRNGVLVCVDFPAHIDECHTRERQVRVRVRMKRGRQFWAGQARYATTRRTGAKLTPPPPSLPHSDSRNEEGSLDGAGVSCDNDEAHWSDSYPPSLPPPSLSPIAVTRTAVWTGRACRATTMRPTGATPSSPAAWTSRCARRTRTARAP